MYLPFPVVSILSGSSRVSFGFISLSLKTFINFSYTMGQLRWILSAFFVVWNCLYLTFLSLSDIFSGCRVLGKLFYLLALWRCNSIFFLLSLLDFLCVIVSFYVLYLFFPLATFKTCFLSLFFCSLTTIFILHWTHWASWMHRLCLS